MRKPVRDNAAGRRNASGGSLVPAFVGGLLGGASVLGAVVWYHSLATSDTDQTQRVQRNGSGGPASELAVQLANLELAQERLQEQLELLQQRLERPAQAARQTAKAGSEPAVPPLAAVIAEPRPSQPTPTPQTTVASAAALVAAGVAEDDAEQMVARLDELALARLEANYRVRQASAAEANQARLDRRAIPQDSAVIRDEFGEVAYDQYLYSLQRPNRVSVASVLRASTAEGAGVQTGDFLRSLDGEPLYSVRDLTERVREGAPGQTYALVVERNGETIETWVPGGPLGVRVSGEVVEPGG